MDEDDGGFSCEAGKYVRKQVKHVTQGGEYFVGGQLTWADIAIFNWMDGVNGWAKVRHVKKINIFNKDFFNREESMGLMLVITNI